MELSAHPVTRAAILLDLNPERVLFALFACRREMQAWGRCTHLLAAERMRKQGLPNGCKQVD